MSDDPLEAYRRERWQANNRDMPGSKADKRGQPQEPLTEHQALELAIDALNQLPNHGLKGEYSNTYALLPVLERTYERAETPHLNYIRDALREPAPTEKTREIDMEPER